jgi:hypothetical protein
MMVISSIFITMDLHLINDYHRSWKIIHNRLSHIYSKQFEFRMKCLKLLFLCPRCSFVLFFHWILIILGGFFFFKMVSKIDWWIDRKRKFFRLSTSSLLI